MFHVTVPPAAIQVFLKMLLSPSMRICSFFTLNSLSSAVAVDTISGFSLKRLAVSFTTAKASGWI